MRYYFTDFCRSEQPVINRLRNEGKFVYALRDGEADVDDDMRYTIEHRVFVNRIGFLVTDTDLNIEPDGYMSDTDFEAIEDKEEDPSLIQLSLWD